MNRSFCIKSSTLAIAMVMASGAVAQNAYLSLGYNFTSMRDSSFDVALGNVKTELDSGTGYSAAFGYQSKSFRTELEYIHTSNDVESHIFEGTRLGQNTGSLAMKHGVMVNLYHDFNHRKAFKPYIGFGIGGAEIQAWRVGTGGNLLLSDSDNAFAAQVIGGFAASLGPNIDFIADVRYQQAFDVKMRTTPAAGSNETNVDFRNQIAKVGFRAKF